MLTDVVAAITDDLGDVAGRQIVRRGELILVRGIGAVENTRQIEQIVIASRETVPVTVGDVAEVVIGHTIRRGRRHTTARVKRFSGWALSLPMKTRPRLPGVLPSGLRRQLEISPKG